MWLYIQPAIIVGCNKNRTKMHGACFKILHTLTTKLNLLTFSRCNLVYFQNQLNLFRSTEFHNFKQVVKGDSVARGPKLLSIKIMLLR